jgi:hypothetical protein
MAKISQLPALNNPDGNELVPVVKNGETMRASVSGLVAGAVAGTVDNLKVDAVAYIGRPGDVVLVDGTPTGIGAIYWHDTVDDAGSVTAVDVFDRAAGTINLAVYRGPRNALVRVALTSFKTTGTRTARRIALAESIAVRAGDMLAVQPTAGALVVAEVQSGDVGYTYSAPYLPETVALDAPTTNGQVQVRFVIAYRKQVVTAATFLASNAVKIVAPRAVALSSDANPRGYVEWTTTGQPIVHLVKWGNYTASLDGKAQRMEFPNYSLAQPYAFVGNSLTDSTDVNNRYSQLLAAEYGQPFISVARYSSDWRMVYRTGAKPIELTLAGALPANGPVAVSRINGSVIDGNNPAAFLTTGDPGVLSGMSMSGYLKRNGITRRATVSAPNGASFAYVVTQAPGQTAITFDGPVTFVPDFALSVRDRICVIWMGNNYFYSQVPNANGDYTNPQMWVDLKLIVAFLQSQGCRVLLIPIIPSANTAEGDNWLARGPGTPYTAMESANARTETEFPGLVARHADGRRFLKFLQDRNDGSPEALDDVAKGFTPRNLRRIAAGVYDLLHMYGDGAGDRAVKDFVVSALQAQVLPDAVTQTTDFIITAIGGEGQLPDTAITRVTRDTVGDIADLLGSVNKQADAAFATANAANKLGLVMKQGNTDRPESYELIASEIGKLFAAFVDPQGNLAFGVSAADGSLVGSKFQALASIIAPLIGVDARGLLKMGAGSQVAFTSDGKITGAGGTTVSMQGSNYDFVICDPANNPLFGWKDGKFYGPRVVTTANDKRINVAFGTGVTVDMGDHNYDFSICDPAGNVLIGWMNGVFYSPIGATGVVDLDAQDVANKSYSQNVYNRRVNTIQRPTAAYNVQVLHGQSLAQGDETWPALSRTNRFGNLMLGGSVQPRNGGNTFLPVGGSATLQPLYAVTIDNANTLYADETTTPAAGGARGEPISYGWANGSRYALAQHLLIEDYTSRRFVALNVAVSGATIGELEKNHSEGGTETYARYTDGLTKLKAIADGEGKSVVVGGIGWLQGEHDYGQAAGHNSLNITYAAYRAKFETMIANMQGDARNILNQALPPVFLTYQTGASYTRDVDSAGTPGMHVGMAQLDVVLANRATTAMVGPVYPYTDKGGHLDSNGSRWFGHQFAKVYHRVAVEGRGWEPLRPIRIWQEGTNTLYVAYHVPHGPLVIDAPQRSGGTEYVDASRGFRVTDSAGNVAVTSAEIVRDTIIKLTCARALNGGAKLWYASQAQGGNGMVRDSDPATAIDNYVYEPERGMYATANIAKFVGKPYPLWNWSVAFFLPVGFKE